MKRIVVLGSTGSIGRQTLDVAKRLGDRVTIVGLAAGRDVRSLREQSACFPSAKLALYDNAADPSIPGGIDAICELATGEGVDQVVVSVAGVIGLLPTVRAIQASKDIALASKEVLVAAGELIMPLARQNDCSIVPIDSEHSALFQCMQGYRSDQVKRLLLTASGGPFRGKSRAELESVTLDQALNHPTWRMGGKITIDSATLMNKALEMIEARWLFDVPMDRVDVVVHPQSVVHSLVEFVDGSVLGQMGVPDMRLPIQYALTFPERLDTGLPAWNPLKGGALTFESFDPDVFWGPMLARRAMELGGTAPCAFNAANEAAANGFLEGRVGFLRIQQIVQEVLEMHDVEPVTLESLLNTDRDSRSRAESLFALRA